MDKILGTFYKGNSKRFGQTNWNTIKDNYDNNNTTTTNNYNNPNNNLSKSQSIYNRNNITSHPKYNHISPNLIRIQYFNNYLDQFEYRRNLHLNDYINNGLYNVYEGSKDPLHERRKDVQNKLNFVRNKLLDEEAERFERRQKKIEQENKMIDDLILEKEYDVNYNKNKNEIALHLMEDFDDKDFEKIYNDKDKKKEEELKSFKSNNDSFLILSRTHSSDSSNMDLLATGEEENEQILEIQRRNSVVNNRRNSVINSPDKKKETGRRNAIDNSPEKREEKFGRKKSTLFNPNRRSSIKNMNNEDKEKDKKKKFKEYEHTDILKILVNLDKYSVPIENVNKELVNQSRVAPKAFEELYQDITQLKKENEKKIENYNNQNSFNLNILNEVLSDLKANQNFLELEAEFYKPKIDEIVENAINKYSQRRFENEFEQNILKEKANMEIDYNLKMDLKERARKAQKIANNLVNQVEDVDHIHIKGNKFQNDKNDKNEINSFYTLDFLNTKNNNKINDKNNINNNNKNKNDIFPALAGLEDNSKDKNDNSDNNDFTNTSETKSDKKRKKRKIKKRKVVVKDLGIIEDDDFLYKDNNNKKQQERKETIIENLDKNIVEINTKEKK